MMFRASLIHLIHVLILAAVLTLVTVSTHIGGWIARFTLAFLPESQRGITHIHTVFAVHSVWSLAAFYGYRKLTKPPHRPSESEK